MLHDGGVRATHCAPGALHFETCISAAALVTAPHHPFPSQRRLHSPARSSSARRLACGAVARWRRRRRERCGTRVMRLTNSARACRMNSYSCKAAWQQHDECLRSAHTAAQQGGVLSHDIERGHRWQHSQAPRCCCVFEELGCTRAFSPRRCARWKRCHNSGVAVGQPWLRERHEQASAPAMQSCIILPNAFWLSLCICSA